MTPAEKVAAGLDLAARGFDELRRERVDLEVRLSSNRAAIVGGEGKALALRYQAMRGRDVRTGAPTGPRRLHDGLRAEVRDVTAETTIGLRNAGLLPSAPRDRGKPRTWRERIFGWTPPALCPHCLQSPCMCSRRLEAPTDPRSA